MEFRILGPLTVVRRGPAITIGSAKARTVLAYLLLHPRQRVSPESLIDEVWSDHPPASATNTLQTYISQLRQLLEPERAPGQGAQVLRSLSGGYLLEVDKRQVDAEVFEKMVREGRAVLEAQEPDKAADQLRRALDLWRGAALADVQGATAEREAARLEELRLVALGSRIEADLALGRHSELVGELEQLVRRYPTREQLVGHLMLALYRCHRQADALALYRTTRERLVEELGINPNPTLQQLERHILQQEPSLEVLTYRGGVVPVQPAPAPSVAVAGDVASQPPSATETIARPAPSRSRRRRRLVITASVVVTTVALIVGAISTLRGDQPDPARAAAPGSVFNEFDLAVRGGIGYDLDIPPGKPTDWHSTNNPRSPDYDFLDLYRTSTAASKDKISGVDLTNTNNFNPIHLVNPSDKPGICLTVPQREGGYVALSDLRVGSKVCLRTHEDRWAMITVTRMPDTRAALLFIRVTVLTS